MEADPASTAAPAPPGAALLRDHTLPSAGRVSFLELFFDLVFVFAVTQIAHLVIEDLTWQGATHALILLLGVWTVWVYTTWATNWLNTEHHLVRLMFFGLMAAGLVLSTSIPEAWGSRALPFAAGIALMQNGRNAFVVWSLRGTGGAPFHNFIRIQFWLVVSGAAWILGAVLDGPERMGLWAAALAFELGSPWWRFWTPGMSASAIEDWQVSAPRFAERCGLFIIIALGESIILTGVTFTGLAWTWPTVAAFAVALLIALAIWWVYYATTADEASRMFEQARRTGGLARAAYTYAHIPIVAGIILTAIGDEILLAHPTGPVDRATAAVILAGPAIFLVGSALFNRLFCGTYPASHGVGLGLLLVAAGFASGLNLLAVATAGAGVLVVVSVWETVVGPRREAKPSRAPPGPTTGPP